MSTSVQGPPSVPPKKTSPIVWIIVAFLGLVMLAGVVVIAGGFFLAKKVQDVTANPALATAKLMAAANPDIEILSSNERNGTVTFKDKQSGKVVTLNFDQIKQGKLVFEEDGNKVAVESSSSGLNIAGADGSTIRIGSGASAKLPEWLPAYPGSTAQTSFSMQGGTEAGAAVSFTTKDPIDKVAKFYEQALKDSGLTVSVNLLQQDGKTAGGMIGAESADKKRSAVVNISAGDDGTTVGITYSDKK